MKLYKRIILSYTVLLAAFTLLVISVFMIPTSWVRGNVAKSAAQIQEEGIWYKPLGFYLFQIDNMTDCLMMQINAYADSRHPVRAAMMAERAKAYGSGDAKNYNNIDAVTLAVAEKGPGAFEGKFTYPRYWHGYNVILRPLLCVFSYKQIRIVNYLAFALMLATVTVLLHRRLGPAYSLTFAAAMLASNVMIVPLAIQFSTCFYIAMLGMMIFLARPGLANRKDDTIIVFFTIGAVTCYLDLLTTPLLTLGMPLVVTAAVSDGGKNIASVAKISMAWLGGYASLWASKWVTAWLVTGENVISDAFENALLRVGNTIVFGGEEMPMSRFFGIITEKISSVTDPSWIMSATLALAICACAYAFICRRKLASNGWLILISLMPLIWFAVMKNHSLQHIFFTWRDWILTLWCLLIFTFKKNDQKNENRNPHTMLQ